MKLALKIDVDTWRGTREGVLPLVTALERAGAGATFLFSLGPDHTGRALRRVFRPGFLSKVSRTSVVSNYGIRTLMYGVLLPGPHIGRRGGDILRQVRAAGFETGIHTYDHVRWQDFVAGKGRGWTLRELGRARDVYAEVFGEPARTHGAAGWQINAHALRAFPDCGFDYCSDTRGTSPFLPVVDGKVLPCPQLPTTLPTLDELIGVDGITESNVADHLLALTRNDARDHVYTLHAEMEGMRYLPVFEQLLAGWKAQGRELVSTRAYFESLDPAALPHCEVIMGEIPGRSGTLALQGPVIS